MRRVAGDGGARPNTSELTGVAAVRLSTSSSEGRRPTMAVKTTSRPEHGGSSPLSTASSERGNVMAPSAASAIMKLFALSGPSPGRRGGRAGRLAALVVLLALATSAILSPAAGAHELEPAGQQPRRSRRLALAGGGLGERPKLIPLVAADTGYSENSSVNILCTVSQGHHESLHFDWFKDGQLIASSPDGQPPDGGSQWPAGSAPQIEKHSDHSLLRIARVQAGLHSGRYTCAAKNQFGQDSSSVNLLVNGE
jgi:hypothetical protein